MILSRSRANGSPNLNNDYGPGLQLRFTNNASESIIGTKITQCVLDVTDGSEDSSLIFNQITNGISADFLFLKAGKVGIGIASTGARLHVAGNITYTGDITDVSDSRLKENITPLDKALDKVSAIRGIYFNNKGESPQEREVGVIAQEVEKVLPEVILEDNEGYKSVAYSKLTPLLIEAIKELKNENEDLKKRITDLESSIKPKKY